jgi:hypothetical protein
MHKSYAEEVTPAMQAVRDNVQAILSAMQSIQMYNCSRG